MNKKIGGLISILLLSLLFITGNNQKLLAQDVTVSYQSFYDNLSPYGQWISDPQYGNVWMPNESGDFRPYSTNGNWVMTDYGNTWVSDDPWGWACYHYGRWTYDPYYGWMWIPGYEWAPAWVSWRFGGGYCGWAPLGPGNGLDFNCPNSWWIFVAPQYLYDHDFYRHWRGTGYNATYLSHTSLVRNDYVDGKTHVRYNFGPKGDAITAVTHQPVKVYHVSQDARPGKTSMSGNNVNLYRPAVNKATAKTARPANVIAAPRAISAPHENNNTSASKQPAFKTQIQNKATANTAKKNGTTGQKTAPVNQARTNNNRAQSQNRPKPAPQQRPQQRPQPQPQPQPQQRPQQQQRPQPSPQQRPQQQQRPQPMPQSRPQPAPQQHEEAPHEGGGRR